MASANRWIPAPLWLVALTLVPAAPAAEAAVPSYTQQAYVKASNARAGTFFGWAVAMDGDVAVVGSSFESSNGSQGDLSRPGAGAAYVFVREGRRWRQLAYLKAPIPRQREVFGYAVAIDGDTIVVGAPGFEDDPTAPLGRGAVYVFVRSGASWVAQARLDPSSAVQGSRFGRAVDIDGDTIAVGADTELPEGATGAPTAAAYVFTRAGALWTMEARLEGPHPGINEGFASCVAVSGDTLAVGIPYAGTDDTRVGAVDVFARASGTWERQVRLTASVPYDGLGASLALDGDTLVAGAPDDDSAARGANGYSADLAYDAGAARVYVRSGHTWAEQAYLKASNTAEGDYFGVAVSIAGDRVVVGAPLERSGASGVDGDQADRHLEWAGAAYAFQRTSGNWSQVAYIKPSNPDAGDVFGATVAISGDSIIVGAPFESGNGRGVDAAPNDQAVAAGAVYVFAAPADTDHDGLPDDWELAFGLNPASGSGQNGAGGDPDGDGITNSREYAIGGHPMGVSQRYLAEGATSSFLDTRIALLNPEATPTMATLTFTPTNASPVPYSVHVQPRTRVTVDPKDVPGLQSAEFSTRVDSDHPLIVDRTLTWDVTRRYGAHTETAVAVPALTWYLAEGATHSGFNLFYLMQNPNTQPAEVRVRFLRPAGAPLEKTYALPPTSRTNIWVNEEEFAGQGKVLAATDVSAVFEVLNGFPIIVERALYMDRPGQTFAAGHESAGVTAPATDWFLAEGMTGTFFDLFVLVANPGDTAAEIEATYLLPDGTVLRRPYIVPPQSRFNIWVDREAPALADTAVSTTIHSSNGVPVIVERALWWPGDFGQWYEAHNSPGATATGARWAIADGEVGGEWNTETYLLVANTSAHGATTQVTLLLENGTSLVRTFSIGAHSRFNVDVAAEFPAASGARFGALVESLGTTPAELVVERASYWNAAGQVWAAGTNALAARLP